MSDYSRENIGFTLVEVLISIGILSVIVTVLLMNQSTYTERAALTNLADEISSTISQAQAYGIGVREFTPGSSNFSVSYGLAFSIFSSNGSNVDYLYFADRGTPGNKFYDGNWSCPVGGASECLDKVNIPRGNYIADICVVRNTGPNPDQCRVANRVDISFLRPSTEAQVVFFNNGQQVFGPANAIGARLVLKSPSGFTKEVIVYKSGQISVQ